MPHNIQQEILNFLFANFDNNYLSVLILTPKLVLSRSKQPVNFVKKKFGLVVECNDYIRNNEVTEPQLFTLG